MPGYLEAQPLPAGATPLTQHVTVPKVLERRMSQIGLVDPEAGARLQAQLLPGQRLVSAEGDLWRWDGFRAMAEDAPSAAALRLQQLNRLEVLKQALEQVSERADAARAAHETLQQQLAEQAEAEGLDRVFSDAGFQWRAAGCSMCLAMNPDKLTDGERCASTSNRNFEGRQGRGGRTHLVSPTVAAATAIAGTFATPADLG